MFLNIAIAQAEEHEILTVYVADQGGKIVNLAR
ncbi:hypothetical protein RB2150_15997 [Rhodobacterales bacterium HTCC2150]|nr:hypothetical protein RB2150_15997 [Rhodobacterales bacterium HTCC2150] [Rhodobacteraceae bacterium HTCC2150]